MEIPIELDSNEGIKILGPLWHPLSDQFLISKGTCVQKLREPKNPPVSKRIISNIVAAIFDPLGLISPVVVVYKIFLQQLWLHKLDWDDQLPSELLNQWIGMYLHLSQVNEITVDRLALTKGQPTEIQLHGFCDSSEKAYGACLYLRSVNQQGSNFVGANREFKTFFKCEEILRQVHDYATKTQFQWHFIPPNSPHFGGLWEAGVKPLKYN